MKFSDLPADVRQRALKRLVANLSKQAIPTTQPVAVDVNLHAALDHLPKLSPLRKTTPEVTPQRIAAKKTTTRATAKPRATIEPRATTTLHAKKQAEPKTRVLRDVQVSDLFATKSHATPAPEAKSSPKTEVQVAASSKPSNEQPVAVTSKTRVMDPTPKPVPAEGQMMTQQVATLKANVQQKKSTGFTMPTLDPVEPAKVAAIVLPNANPVSTHTAQHSQINQKSKWVLPPQVSELKSHATPSAAPSIAPAIEAVAQSSSSARQQQVSETSEPAAQRTDVKTLAFSSLSRELDPLPHELHRDQFRVSRVGLPDPDDFLASLPSTGTPVQQATTHRSTVETQRSDVLSIPTEPGHQKTVQASSVSAGDVEMKRDIAKQVKTPSYELPPAPSVVNEVAIVSPISERNSLHTDPTTLAKLADAELPTPAPSIDQTTVATDRRSMSDQELYDALLSRLTDPSQAETPAERSRRLIMARHLMVLSGDREAAVKEMKGLSAEEQEFLRHQLEGLYAMVDPKGHPVAGRRFSSALPELRQATMHLSAASDTLEVRGLEFCTEIEAYGQVKPFPTRQFAAGQQVILYCEVENFTAKKAASGYETHLKGSYDVYNESGTKLISQLLPADKQLSRNLLRDYFVAYQMSLPAKLPAGKYRLQLTMEDVGGEKYGQSDIQFEILPPK